MIGDVVLWLDLAEADKIEDDTVREHLPSGAMVLRLSEYGAPRYPLGTPIQWRPVLDAIDRLVGHARRLESQLTSCRYWVTGRAGLPAFAHLGYRLRKLAAVTFVHQASKGGPTEVMRLDASSGAASQLCFVRTPWPIPHNDGTAPVVLVVSSVRRPATQHVEAAMAQRRTGVGLIVQAHASERIDATTVGPAMRELEQTLREACDAHPARSTLAIFIAGQSTLAFLVGCAINPRACRDVQIFELDGNRYSLAYQLPYPVVPDRNRVLSLLSSPPYAAGLRLDEEIRAVRLEQHEGTVANRLDIDAIPMAQPNDLLDLLRRYEPGVVHFSGHGKTGELLFQADDGSMRPVATSDLAEVFRLAGGLVRLVVLNACDSESLARALLAHVDCIVAMRGPIHDVDARRFSAAFYRQLAEGDSVRDAFDKAVLAMRLEQPAGSADSRARNVEDTDEGSAAAEEPPQLLERDPGHASLLSLVRRR
jgi:hypothetical protein